jgi:hypothetical protein
MSKNRQIIIAVALPMLFAGLLVLIDFIWFPPPVFQNESGITFGIGLYERPFFLFDKNPFFDLGGSTFAAEIMRHLALFLILTSVLLPIFFKYMEKPIERTELNLTD